jgi:ribosomal protein L40E
VGASETPLILARDNEGSSMVGVIEQKETVDLKLCNSCQAEMRERDRFCRRCGGMYSGGIGSAVTKDDWPDSLTIANTGSLRPPRMTASLGEEHSYRPFSDSLTKAVAAGVSTGPLTLSYSPLVKNIIMGLITIPIWLIIVLLSPFDAYATAKSVSARGGFN